MHGFCIWKVWAGAKCLKLMGMGAVFRRSLSSLTSISTVCENPLWTSCFRNFVGLHDILRCCFICCAYCLWFSLSLWPISTGCLCFTAQIRCMAEKAEVTDKNTWLFLYKHRVLGVCEKKNRGMERVQWQKHNDTEVQESWAHQSPLPYKDRLQEEKSGVQSLAQWGSAWLPSSILMRGQDTRKDVVCSVSADRATGDVSKGDQVCPGLKTGCPTHHPGNPSRLNPGDDWSSFTVVFERINKCNLFLHTWVCEVAFLPALHMDNKYFSRLATGLYWNAYILSI